MKEANTTIETLRKDNQDNAKLQKQVNTYKNKVVELETAAANSKKEYALKEKLSAAGVLDADYLIYKQGGVDKFTFDKEGIPVGLDDILKPMKEASPHLFKARPRCNLQAEWRRKSSGSKSLEGRNIQPHGAGTHLYKKTLRWRSSLLLPQGQQFEKGKGKKIWQEQLYRTLLSRNFSIRM